LGYYLAVLIGISSNKIEENIIFIRYILQNTRYKYPSSSEAIREAGNPLPYASEPFALHQKIPCALRHTKPDAGPRWFFCSSRRMVLTWILSEMK
jgi:hypothetical protein